jgi:hypothetical protein
MGLLDNFEPQPKSEPLKGLLTVVLVFGVCAMSFAQQEASDDNLVLIYGAEKISTLQADNPSQLDFLKYENESGYYLAEMPGEKQIAEYPDALEHLAIHESFAAINHELLEEGILLGAYGFEVTEKAYGYYRVGNSSTLMVVYPRELIEMLYAKEQ